MRSHFLGETREDFLALDANRIPSNGFAFVDDDSDLTELDSSDECTPNLRISAEHLQSGEKAKALGAEAGRSWRLVTALAFSCFPPQLKPIQL